MQKSVLPIVIVVLALAGMAVLSTALLLARNTAETPVLHAGPPSDLVMPPFSATDQDGLPVDQTLLEDGYTVVDFFFTSCPTWCPAMTAAMQFIQDSTTDTSVRFFSLSIDGATDTPEQLRRYIEGYAVDPDRWTFATAPPADVAKVVTDGLGFDLSLDPGMIITKADGTTGPMINHPTRLLLIGPNRQVIGLFRHDDPDELELLISESRRLAG